MEIVNNIAKNIHFISLEEEMRRSYLDYAMSVIIGRALPDVRDGLKPVHRRILFAMYELNNDWNKAYKKAARIVGNVIGKYHPHGDVAVYDTIVRMAQNFSMRYALVDGQGNFGSIDGDNAAAMRYTEIRLSKIAHELLNDLDQETVDFCSNYDSSEIEPTLLPARIPNLLINGSSGIAVGMATNIPPHNLDEIINACLYLLKKPDCCIDKLIEIVQAPDFPTAGIIYGVQGAHNAYKTGRGCVILRAKTHFESINHGQHKAIVVDELPYRVNKKSLLEHIVSLLNEKKIESISDIQDESDQSGMRIVISLKKEEIPEIVLNNLYKNTQLQDTFNMNMVALVNNQPKLLNLKQMLECFLEHRKQIIIRRTLFELKKARERDHLLEGLAIALTNIDEFVAIVKTAITPTEAKNKLMIKPWYSSILHEMTNYWHNNHFHQENMETGIKIDGSYKLSEKQTQEILNMRLQRLTSFEHNKLLSEYKNIKQKITDLLNTLNDPEKISSIVQEELECIQKEFGQKGLDNGRRSHIIFNTPDFLTEDLIIKQNVVVTLSYHGYIKSQLLTEYRTQKRGGRGKKVTPIKNEDCISTLFIANTHDTILCFSNYGRIYWLKVWEIPQTSRSNRGKPIINFFPLAEKEKITTILPIKEYESNKYIFMATRKGIVKKTCLSDFSNPRKTGIIAIDLDDMDYLIGAAITDSTNHVMLFSNVGKAVRFHEKDVRSTGRTARGVIGMNLSHNQNVIAMLVASSQKEIKNKEKNILDSVLIVTENGFGKRTPLVEYTLHKRGSKGIIAIQTTKRNGNAISAILVSKIDQIMLITTGGILARIRVSDIREMGRATQGVTLINIGENEILSGLQRIAENNEEINIETIANDEIIYI